MYRISIDDVKPAVAAKGDIVSKICIWLLRHIVGNLD